MKPIDKWPAQAQALGKVAIIALNAGIDRKLVLPLHEDFDRNHSVTWEFALPDGNTLFAHMTYHYMNVLLFTVRTQPDPGFGLFNFKVGLSQPRVMIGPKISHWCLASCRHGQSLKCGCAIMSIAWVEWEDEMLEDALLVLTNKEAAETLAKLLKDARIKVVAPGFVEDVKTSFYEYIYMIGDCNATPECRHLYHTTVKAAAKPSTVWYWN